MADRGVLPHSSGLLNAINELLIGFAFIRTQQEIIQNNQAILQNSQANMLNNQVTILTEQMNMQSNLAGMWNHMREFSAVERRLESKIDALNLLFLNQQNTSHRTQQMNQMTESADIICLPVGEIDVFYKLNRMAENASFRSNLRKQLMVAGGSDSKALAVNILRQIMVDDLAEQLSFTENPSESSLVKPPFVKTTIYRLILEICIHTFSGSEESVKQAISEYFMQAESRKSQRESRCSQGDGLLDTKAKEE